ncbi:hypothetical protein Hanom_Chr03g00204011 [Helianthus anomalus]
MAKKKKIIEKQTGSGPSRRFDGRKKLVEITNLPNIKSTKEIESGAYVYSALFFFSVRYTIIYYTIDSTTT